MVQVYLLLVFVQHVKKSKLYQQGSCLLKEMAPLFFYAAAGNTGYSKILHKCLSFYWIYTISCAILLPIKQHIDKRWRVQDICTYRTLTEWGADHD